MKILFASPDHWNHPLPYHIAPRRVARACVRAGHENFCIDLWHINDGAPLNPPNKVFQTPWGKSIHASDVKNYREILKTTIEEYKPDLIYLFGWLTSEDIFGIEKTGIPFGLHRADPYWKPAYLPADWSIKLFGTADFMTFNEGQAWNYCRLKGLGEKAHLLNHAVDPELAPPLEEVRRTDKRYLCSTVMGGEDPPRLDELIEKYYMATDDFPNHLFIGAGGIGKSMMWKIDEQGRKVPNDFSPSHTQEETRFYGRTFNMSKMFHFQCLTFLNKTNSQLLCHEMVHHLYSQSYYGFTPWGDYLRTGILGEYNTKTFGTKTFEIGGSGAAMLSCHIADIEDVVKDGKTGFITHNTEDTKDAFQYAIDNPKEVRKMGEAAWKDLHKRHSWDVRYQDVLVPIFRDLGLL